MCHAAPRCAMPCYPVSGHAMQLCCLMLFSAMLCHIVQCYAMLRYATLCYAMLRYAMLCYAMLCHAMLCHGVCRVPWGEALLSLEPAWEKHDPTNGQVLTRGLSARVGIFHGPITRLCPHAVTGELLLIPTCCSLCFLGASSRLSWLFLLCWCFCCCYCSIVTACGRLGFLVLCIWLCAQVCGNVLFTWLVYIAHHDKVLTHMATLC